jgi:dTDP-glucose 4,6-dehydratase
MRPHDGRVVPTFIHQALHGEDISVFGDGFQTRSFCYVSDLVEGIMSLVEADYHGPVNLGNPNEMTVLDFAHTILKITGGKSGISFHPLPEDDPKVRRPDISLAMRILGWEPKVSLEEGLKNTIAYFRDVVS